MSRSSTFQQPSSSIYGCQTDRHTLRRTAKNWPEIVFPHHATNFFRVRLKFQVDNHDQSNCFWYIDFFFWKLCFHFQTPQKNIMYSQFACTIHLVQYSFLASFLGIEPVCTAVAKEPPSFFRHQPVVAKAIVSRTSFVKDVDRKVLLVCTV